MNRRTFLAAGAATVIAGCTGPVGGGESSTPPGPPPGTPNSAGKAECEFGNERSLKVGGAARIFPGIIALKEAVILRPVLQFNEVGEVIGAQKVAGRDDKGALELAGISGVMGWQITKLGSETPPMGMMPNDGCVDLDGARRTLVPSQAVTLEQSFEFSGNVIPVFEPGIAERNIAHDSLWKVGAFGVHISLHTETAKSIPADLVTYTNQAIKL